MLAVMTPDIAAGFRKAGAAGAQRHAFLCLGPDCCDPVLGAAVWETLKSAVARHRIPVMRTKAACLRICLGGPWLVVYPEGTWYGDLTPERCERIVAQHLAAGQPVQEWVAATHPLGAAPAS
jgi:(2Fe-2S) ferredoxin